MTEYYDENGEWVSKTQRKRECDELQKLGEELISLNNEELEKFDLPDALNAAIKEAKKIRQHGALKRQRQYIGKLMRDIDADPIEQQLHELRHKDDLHNIHFKRLEQWRDRIMAEGDKAINELLGEYPNADRQYLRQLHRNALKEQKTNKPPVSFRQIFKYIRELSNQG